MLRAGTVPGAASPTGWTRQEPVHDGRALSLLVENRSLAEQELMQLAFDAIRDMGPEAWPAVPELTRVITAAFVPIRVATDTDEQIASKIRSAPRPSMLWSSLAMRPRLQPFRWSDGLL